VVHGVARVLDRRSQHSRVGHEPGEMPVLLGFVWVVDRRDRDADCALVRNVADPWTNFRTETRCSPWLSSHVALTQATHGASFQAAPSWRE
jgi:hypothetical protein